MVPAGRVENGPPHGSECDGSGCAARTRDTQIDSHHQAPSGVQWGHGISDDSLVTQGFRAIIGRQYVSSVRALNAPSVADGRT